MTPSTQTRPWGVMAYQECSMVVVLFSICVITGTTNGGGVDLGPHFDACHINYTLLHANPIGRGFQKEVWLANVSGWENNPVGMKQLVALHDTSVPPGYETPMLLKRRYTIAANAEVRMIRSFNGHPNIMELLGVCWIKQFFIVKPVAPVLWGVFDGDVPWCFRLDLAKQAMDLVAFLHQHNMMHCDLKPDQLGVSMQGLLKLVDLDTIFKYKGAGAFMKNRTCTVKTTPTMECCGGACMKHSEPKSGCACPANGWCPKISSDTTLVTVMCTMMFPKLFGGQAFKDGPTPNVNTSQTMQGHMKLFNKRCSSGTVDVKEALGFITSTIASHQSEYDVCTAEKRNHFEQGIAAALHNRIEQAPVKCEEKRYC
eukprot:m.265453 g.265453  ORF g.265453 m.265453 type:complete len:370 (-) comp61878_c1_seq1:98-1207(-)